MPKSKLTEFRELQRKWDEKLAKSGFVDIERKDRVGASSRMLKTAALKNIVDQYTPEQFEIKQEYYRLAGQFLHDHKFKSGKDREIWRLHSEGVSIRNIIRHLKRRRMTAYKDLVHGTILRLAEEMKEYARNR